MTTDTMSENETVADDKPPSTINWSGLPELTPQAVKLISHPDSRIAGAVSSSSWLPADLWPALTEARDEHWRLLMAVDREGNALRDLGTQWRAEDREREEDLQRAHRYGSQPPDDERTPPDKRRAKEAPHVESFSAALLALSAFADATITMVRDHEEEWLTTLRQEVVGIEDKRRQAAQMLSDAKSEEFRAHRLGRWLQQVSDDDGIGQQPAPIIEDVPDLAQLPTDGLERHWTRRRPWTKVPVR